MNLRDRYQLWREADPSPITLQGLEAFIRGVMDAEGISKDDVLLQPLVQCVVDLAVAA